MMDVDEAQKLIMIFIPLTFGTDMSSENLSNVGHLTQNLMATFVETANILFPTFIYEFLLDQVESLHLDKSSLACKLLAQSTGCNVGQFTTPILFHFFTEYKMLNATPVCIPLKRRFLATIYAALLRHGKRVENLRTIYSLICALIVTDSSTVDAAMTIILLMKIQNYINENGMAPVYSNQIHALIASCMTLFCWVHRGENLLNYVKIVLDKRSTEAPHLLPPIKLSYKYASHHVRWNHKPLFFDGWELRYALWKTFVTKNDVLPAPKRG